MNLLRSLEVTPVAPSSARRSLEFFADIIPRDRLDDLRIVVSELVTNCVRHSGLSKRDRIQLKVQTLPGCMRVEVSDRGMGFGPESARCLSEDGGWGLAIVDRLATRWGLEGGPQTTVWAELALA